jgi:hypothetical protein
MSRLFHICKCGEELFDDIPCSNCPGTDCLPVIHINGTGKKTLLESYERVEDALLSLADAWDKVEFNPRDYYTAGVGSFELAIEERNRHALMIRHLNRYIAAHILHIQGGK